ncbi:MAG: RimK family alpha-L-glutamate ligase [Ferroplasma sp.]|uniref:RimK family alpha-L-glutamate ligase n=1 Tax=Ferroplasma sp. TaxID=2591003 RepID=UPI002815DD03|nr:RimK family alpha-L-glutamate ligase [Ferroplasma sp.]WMT51073.1 MAG: RimK family alpha-L-glutamate ligase [Ferroplasma sp.]
MLNFIYDSIAWEEKQIIKELQGDGIKLNLINAKDHPLSLTGDIDITGPAVIRCMSAKRSLYYSYILESHGIETVNSFNTFNIAGNKAFTTSFLYRNGINTPDTVMSFSHDNAMDAAGDMGYPVVFKPSTGSWGRMISLIRDANMAETVFSMNDMVAENSYYIQSFVKRPPRDIRVIMVGGKISASIYRYSGEGWKTNLYLGGRVEKAVLGKEETEIIMKVSDLFGPGIIGIDAMESESGITVHEVNSRVEFKGASRVYGNAIIRDIAEYLKTLD